jgi:hypothetical protein
MNNKIIVARFSGLILLVSSYALVLSCKNSKTKYSKEERQITFDSKTHALDNNDNFSPDGKFLCYDTRGMVYNNNLANCKSIEKVEIITGNITVLWEPESVSGENGAPGVAAVSYHPTENKVIFIHGPFLDEVEDRGSYDIKNRTGKVVSADGKGKMTAIDMRDHSMNKPTISGAHRGGTHRHEYSRNGKRIGFTYDDFIQQDYDRSIAYLDENENAPEGFTHYFAMLLKPTKKGMSKPGEIEKAYSDSWVDKNGTKRAFIGKVRAANGVDYETSLFVVEIPDTVDITTAYSGDKDTYPTPPRGITYRRLTHSTADTGIVRGSYNGENIAYLSEDDKGIQQVFVIATDGSDVSDDPDKRPKKITKFASNASNIRWHSSDNFLFSISDGKIYVTAVGNSINFGNTELLTPDNLTRGDLVVSPKGDMLAYTVKIKDEKSTLVVEGKIKDEFDQIFVMNISELK